MNEADKIKQTVSDINVVFSSPQGKRVYEQLATLCFKHRSTFVKDSCNESANNEGARKVILEIDRWLEYDLSTLDETGETDNIEPERK